MVFPRVLNREGICLEKAEKWKLQGQGGEVVQEKDGRHKKRRYKLQLMEKKEKLDRH